MSKHKILCALLCGVLLMTSVACGKTTNEEPTTTETTVVTTTEPQQTEPVELAEATTEAETEAEAVEITLENGLNSTKIEDVLAFYQLAAAKNADKKYHKKMALVNIDGGEGWVGNAVSYFEPIAQKAIAKNSIDDEPMPGDYKNIRPTDWQSAKAVSDGTYTTITVQMVPQTDGAYGKLLEGTVGRTMSVLDGIKTAVDELPGVSVDFEKGKISLSYVNPTMVVKIDNRTGEFVPDSCKWSYRVSVDIPSLDAKILGFSVHLKNANGNVDYSVSY